MTTTLQQLNSATPAEALRLLDGLYEHSPWIAEQALAQRPFVSLAALKHAMVTVLANASVDAQLALIRAHPELAGKAMESRSLTAESTNEQQKAGLTNCTPEELAHIQRLNAQYIAKFGFPFILAVRGPRGTGLSKREIIATVERRLGHPVDFERAECLRHIHRIAEIRLNDKFGFTPAVGNAVWDWHEDLARHSDPGFAEQGQLTVTYLTDAHRACAADLVARMQACGFDQVNIDAVGNVVGRYHGATPQAPALLTGSHFDTVRNGGKYDGRLGIFVPMACVKRLHAEGKRLPFAIEVVGFAEEEGQRYKATFLGSGALTGHFNPAWLDQQDADGVTMRAAMQHAGLPATLEAIGALKRDPSMYLGFVEVHIEQGPVLNELDLPLGVVTSINASVRYQCEAIGMASHAGTTPMNRRRDAASCRGRARALRRAARQRRRRLGGHHRHAAGARRLDQRGARSLPLLAGFARAEQRAARCAGAATSCRNCAASASGAASPSPPKKTMRAAAAPSAPAWQARWEHAVTALGVPLHRMPSGAGHDAMKLHEVMPQAMLFVRGLNSGISHNPLESTTSDDIELCVNAFSHLLDQLASEHKNGTP